MTKIVSENSNVLNMGALLKRVKEFDAALVVETVVGHVQHQ